MVAIAYSGGEDAGKRRRPSLVQVVDGLSIVTVIRKKRDGEELSDSEIEWFVSAATNSLITEAQIGTVLERVYIWVAEGSQTLSSFPKSHHKVIVKRFVCYVINKWGYLASK